MKRSQRLFIVVGTLGGVSVAAACLFIYFGVYNVSALEQHTSPVYRLLQLAMVRSVAARSDMEVPDLAQLDWQNNGLRLYEQNCQQCHGAPGAAADGFSLGMVPAPTAIASVARKREPSEIFWVIQQGIKMSGMPAWRYRLSRQEIWEVVAFIDQVPNLTVAEYSALRDAADTSSMDTSASVDSLHPVENNELARRGHLALQQYNCHSCHRIPGVTGATNDVGPPLDGLTQRAFIAGVLKYSEENLVRWIRFPGQVDPDSAMPNLGVTETHARQMVAYFQSLEESE